MKEWRVVFWVTFVVFVVTTIIYCIWASGELQPWNNPERKHLIESGEEETSKADKLEPKIAAIENKEDNKDDSTTEKKEPISIAAIANIEKK